jgi:SAM-dependent methyltransferase
METVVARENVAACPACGAPDRAEFLRRADVVQCASCDVLYVSPRPTDAAIAAFYSTLGRYDRWDTELGRTRMWERRLARVRRHVAGGRLLDVGTGQGDFGVAAREHFAFEGTEISSEGARLARERHGLTVHEGDCLNLVLPKKRYQVITIWHVLEHVANPRELVEHCRELLDDGGLLAIAVPNADEDWRVTRLHWDSAVQFAIGRPPRSRFGVPGVDLALRVMTGINPQKEVYIPRLQLTHSEEEIHLTHFTLDTLAHMLEAAGLHVVERGIDDHSPELGLSMRLRHYRQLATYRVSGRAAASAIFVAARKAR